MPNQLFNSGVSNGGPGWASARPTIRTYKRLFCIFVLFENNAHFLMILISITNSSSQCKHDDDMLDTTWVTSIWAIIFYIILHILK